MSRKSRVLIALGLLTLAFPAAFGVLLAIATAGLAIAVTHLTVACAVAAVVLLASTLRRRRFPLRFSPPAFTDDGSS